MNIFNKFIYVLLMLIIGIILIISLFLTIFISPLVIIFSVIKLILKEIPKNVMIFWNKVFNNIDKLINYLDNRFNR